MKNCQNCKEGKVVGRRRTYCGPVCAREPKKQWKRDARRISKGSGFYYSNQWGTPESRRAYFSNYMRERRAKQRLEKRQSPSEER